jgi:hypothetical protein
MVAPFHGRVVITTIQGTNITVAEFFPLFLQWEPSTVPFSGTSEVPDTARLPLRRRASVPEGTEPRASALEPAVITGLVHSFGNSIIFNDYISYLLKKSMVAKKYFLL